MTRRLVDEDEHFPFSNSGSPSQLRSTSQQQRHNLPTISEECGASIDDDDEGFHGDCIEDDVNSPDENEREPLLLRRNRFSAGGCKDNSAMNPSRSELSEVEGYKGKDADGSIARCSQLNTITEGEG